MIKISFFNAFALASLAQIRATWEETCDHAAVLNTWNPHIPPDGSATWTSYCIGACVEQLDDYCRNVVGYRTAACCQAHWETVACFANVCTDAAARMSTNPYNSDLAACDLSQTSVNKDLGTVSTKLRYCEYSASSADNQVTNVFTTAGVLGLPLGKTEAYVGFSCEKSAVNDFNPRPDPTYCQSECAIFPKFVKAGETASFCSLCTYLENGSVTYDCQNIFPDTTCAQTNDKGQCVTTNNDDGTLNDKETDKENSKEEDKLTGEELQDTDPLKSGAYQILPLLRLLRA